ncbi:metallophosphoesterase family protein [Lederbergia sp. NSJ-179]|uniref:metallophosphoesterase family protein n=1 Tax=Lederbergia sp. NSJ-179 TaxID=2931402 RepID=UPI001FD5B894|nr:metallophosphoesterase family protein [Lederbergia sp. NSJ-179]MCJ7842233.1 metallophosphoesterase family protein [Lederbergia sp. NSJ-179]
MGKQLKFHKNQSFKIVQFTDLHVGGEENQEDKKTFHVIRKVVECEKPDLIVVTGDLIWSEGVKHPDQSYRRVLDQISEWDIPFATVFGNHDAEANITREQLLQIHSEYTNSLTMAGPDHIHGVGNYSLSIQSSTKLANEAVLYFLDSGDYAPKSVGGYAWVHPDQVSWFMSEAKKYALPALAFFHIPLPEYRDVLSFGKVSGNKLEQVCAPMINSGLFTALLESGEVMGTFVGHDHDNDYCGELCGISLCYGRVSGYNTYGKLQRGARVIQLSEGQRKFDTWIRLDDGNVIASYTHEHKPKE